MCGYRAAPEAFDRCPARVVVYAEGGREIGGLGPPPSPNTPLGEEDLGPAHWLVRRALSLSRSLPEGAILFEEGLRVGHGRRPRGAQLLERERLRQLCTWADPRRAPALVVIFVDNDGDVGRLARLTAFVEGVHVPVVIGVAVQEFESWLIADQRAASDATMIDCTEDRPIESLEPRVAKQRLQSAIAAQNERRDRDIRNAIARTCDLAVVARRCPSFHALLTALETKAI